MPDDLQFEEAELDAPPPLPTTCDACGGALVGSFWVEDGRLVVCEGCRVARSSSGGFSVGRLLGGLLGGTLAAFATGAAWGVIGVATGYNIGLIAILAGAGVAFGILTGAGGGGGPIFQAMAALLTYLAIVVNEAVAVAWYALQEGSAPFDILLTLILAVPLVAVSLVPSTIEAGGFISLIIYGFAIFQAVQMTAGGTSTWEGPFSTEPHG